MSDRGPPVSEGGSPTELLRALAVFAEPPEPGHAAIAKSLGLVGSPEPSVYADVFLFQLYPYASVHLGPEGMMGGVARDRVAGFWSALGYEVPPEPDHVAALLGLYADLSSREGASSGAERTLLRESRSALMHEQLAPWIFAFLGRVKEIAPDPYRGWATLLGDVLAVEDVLASGRRGTTVVDALPVHLSSTSGIDDPRVAGAPAFLESLLAPVRSGMILTRSDLASCAASADAGLRAGERRYALEHLLAQNHTDVLECLASEAARQGRLHDERVPQLGRMARVLSDRCAKTRTLLRELAENETSGMIAASEDASRGDEYVVGPPSRA